MNALDVCTQDCVPVSHLHVPHENSTSTPFSPAYEVMSCFGTSYGNDCTTWECVRACVKDLVTLTKPPVPKNQRLHTKLGVHRRKSFLPSPRYRANHAQDRGRKKSIIKSLRIWENPRFISLTFFCTHTRTRTWEGEKIMSSPPNSTLSSLEGPWKKKVWKTHFLGEIWQTLWEQMLQTLYCKVEACTFLPISVNKYSPSPFLLALSHYIDVAVLPDTFHGSWDGNFSGKKKDKMFSIIIQPISTFFLRWTRSHGTNEALWQRKIYGTKIKKSKRSKQKTVQNFYFLSFPSPGAASNIFLLSFANFFDFGPPLFPFSPLPWFMICRRSDLTRGHFPRISPGIFLFSAMY